MHATVQFVFVFLVTSVKLLVAVALLHSGSVIMLTASAESQRAFVFSFVR